MLRVFLVVPVLLGVGCSRDSEPITPTQVAEIDIISLTASEVVVTKDGRKVPMVENYMDKRGAHFVFNFGDRSLKWDSGRSTAVGFDLYVRSTTGEQCAKMGIAFGTVSVPPVDGIERYRSALIHDGHNIWRSYMVYYDGAGKVLLDTSYRSFVDEFPTPLVPCK